MPHIGFGELILILVIALIIFGPGKLPSVGGAIGKAFNEFKKASKELTSGEPAAAVKEEPQSQDAAPAAVAAPAAAAAHASPEHNAGK